MPERCLCCGWPLAGTRERYPDRDVLVDEHCARFRPWEHWPDDAADAARIAVVGCGQLKAGQTTAAKDLYTSSYFNQKRRYAEVACDSWWILSAEHGMVGPHVPLVPYDTTMADHDDEGRQEWLDTCRRGLRFASAWHRNDAELVVLAGRDYIDPLADVLDRVRLRVRDPFADTDGLPEQRTWLSERIDAHAPTEQESLAAFGGGEAA